MNRFLITAMMMMAALRAAAEDVEIASNNNVRIFLREDSVWRFEDTMHATVYGVTHDGMLSPDIITVMGCLHDGGTILVAPVSAWDAKDRSNFTPTLWAKAGKTIGDGIAVAICAHWSSAPTSTPYPGSLRKAPEAPSESERAERKTVRAFESNRRLS